jgi:hypothetical protein
MTNSDQMVVSRFGGFKVLIIMTNLVQKVIMLRHEMVITDIIEFSKLFLINLMPLTTNLNGHTTITSILGVHLSNSAYMSTSRCHQCLHVNI